MTKDCLIVHFNDLEGVEEAIGELEK